MLWTQGQELLSWTQEDPQLLPKVLVLPFLELGDRDMGSSVTTAFQVGN